ncbi:5-(carboxyamino)imidazole ribonucleotide synthase [Paralcaligenes ureilyticus]|uniref:N5-carboxyaminoimidazole ribonucleotide synthase n=1 Tax=Paralcaligenes ureilyticus TaxID=627131 RepID=A0A4R3LXD5_9BURK|nr:5-(carboxyamino)imidazole ribonucleotide synthase [Paralcaligenes ureilyticus]TCT05310.1 5-(carboxyamino)imidazole ribonucleotide synthase [Paralcaligenes ureilyticus]
MATNAVPPVLPIAPGNWLGMIGGGQLGRMFCQAAQSMGYKVAVLDPIERCPAGAVADLHIQTAYDDQAGLARLSERCAAISTEFENVPALSLQKLAAHSRVSPAAEAVAIVQDRILEKAFIGKMGVPLAPYAAIHGRDDIERAPSTLFPGILKAARFGYDGKGQARIASREQALEAFDSFGGAACVLEALMPLESEFSVVLARGFDGRAVTYPCARNEHHDGILAVSTVATEFSAAEAALHRQAGQAALNIAQGLGYYGVLCVEFFVLRDGALVANEIAPRPHNSGHYTMDACVTSQFEQQVRVMAGLPLGSTDSLCPALMLNILGDVWFDPATGEKREPDWSAVLRTPNAKLHLYGKQEARRGRKMGHINLVAPTLSAARDAAAAVAGALHMPFSL